MSSSLGGEAWHDGRKSSLIFIWAETGDSSFANPVAMTVTLYAALNHPIDRIVATAANSHYLDDGVAGSAVQAVHNILTF
jgi:hypothetical protein